MAPIQGYSGGYARYIACQGSRTPQIAPCAYRAGSPVHQSYCLMPLNSLYIKFTPGSWRAAVIWIICPCFQSSSPIAFLR